MSGSSLYPLSIEERYDYSCRRREWNALKARDEKLKTNILKKSNYRCWYCGKENESLTFDHIIPIIRGGKNNIENLVASCKKCNSSKRELTVNEWRLRLLSKENNLYFYKNTTFYFETIK